MAGAGSKLFTAGSVLTAAQVNTYLMDQTIMRFATTTARDDAFGGAGEATLAEGMFAYVDANDTLYYYTGSAWAEYNRSGLTLVKSQTIGTAVSSVQVTDAFSSTYDNYLVIVGGGSATADVTLNLTFGSTTTGYKWVTEIVTWDSPQATNETGGNNAANIGYVGASSTTSIGAHITILNPNLAENTFVIADGVFDGDNGGGWTRGLVDNTTQYTDFTLTTSSGTMTGGTIRVYGYRN